MMVRRPISLRISLTDRCQLNCLYCSPVGTRDESRRRDPLTQAEIIRFVRAVAVCFTVQKVRLTGGEPLLRSDIVSLVESLAAEGIPDLAVTTNGQHLVDLAPHLKRAGLRRVNVSLDSLSEASFRSLTRNGSLRRVLEGLSTAKRCGMAPVKTNTVVLRGRNDQEVVDIARFAVERGYEARFLELMPLGRARAIFKDAFVASADVRSRLEAVFRLRPLPRSRSSTCQTYRVVDRHGRVGKIGFISPHSAPFCGDCTRVRLTSEGLLIACLARGRGVNVRDLLQEASPASTRELQRTLLRELRAKGDRAPLESLRPMISVGG